VSISNNQDQTASTTETIETENNERPFYTADVVAVTPDGRVLLIQRGWDPFEGAWALPGGHVDAGETALDAAVRELAEETGVRVAGTDLTLVGVFDRPGRDPRGRYVTVAYTVTVPAGTTARAGDDAVDVLWVPLGAPAEGLPADSALAFDHAEILTAAHRVRLAAGYARQVQEETSGDRCPAAHPSDPSPCSGPIAVTVADSKGAGVDGCEHHAARMIASLREATVHAIPGADPESPTRTAEAASSLRPYVWRQPLIR